jgi:hypothetical protein
MRVEKLICSSGGGEDLQEIRFNPKSKLKSRIHVQEKKENFSDRPTRKKSYSSLTCPEHMDPQILRTDVRLPQKAFTVTNKYSPEF